MLGHVNATRYVTPLREGGSLPGLMEADDLGTYVVKFRGAGQGRSALVAEVVSAGLARGLGLRVPDLVTVEVDPALAAGEPDQEVQDLLRASAGLNLGVDFLPGALDFDPTAFPVDASTAGQVLWFDALVGNVDRSRRNPNLLHWRDRAGGGSLWLIDHGATLTFHHRWSTAGEFDARPYDARDHVLADSSPDLDGADRVVRELRANLELRHAIKAPAMDHDTHHRMVRAKAEGTAPVVPAGPIEWEPPIQKVISAKGTGIDELVAAVASHQKHLVDTGEKAKREQTRAMTQFLTLLRDRLLRAGLERLERERGNLTDVAQRIAERKADPYVLADEIALTVR